VSSATVSLVINGKGNINEQTREKVKKIAAEFNYVPNITARALRQGRMNSIGVVINRFHNPFFFSVFKGIEDIVGSRGYTFWVSQSQDSLAKEKEQVLALADRGVDGLIVMPCARGHSHLESVRERYRIPVVLIANHFDKVAFPAVVADNAAGARMAVEHLMALGRPVVHIAGAMSQSMVKLRREAFRAVVRERLGRGQADRFIFEVAELTPACGCRVMEEVMAAFTPPLSIFVVNDETAMGVMRYCRDHGLRIPEDIALVGFGNVELLENLGIPLSSVNIPAVEMGRKAAEMVIGLVEGTLDRNCTDRLDLPVSLVVREGLRLGTPGCPGGSFP
jgi:LacI family transcriptional regulator